MADMDIDQSPRRDAQNRRLCRARSKRTRELCNAPAMRGQEVCRLHGGSTQRSRRKAALRLAELVDPAVATLGREMAQADKSSDRLRAANSILDRAGYGRVQKVEVNEAREQLIQRLLQMRAERGDEYELDETDLDALGAGITTDEEPTYGEA